jgi:hypothetical protein
MAMIRPDHSALAALRRWVEKDFDPAIATTVRKPNVIDKLRELLGMPPRPNYTSYATLAGWQAAVSKATGVVTTRQDVVDKLAKHARSIYFPEP